ncbi:unnamed protein product [Enterobius vermicularis]|uniref:TBD domain-containing protein n=1 Tax=Enterobius vermicularis TaxID=51028 RepID=A0A0N4V2C4_ENTVE|nr:unnamed protein product [Enterobius vermicularis]
MRAFLTPKELQEHFDTHDSQREVPVDEASSSPSFSSCNAGYPTDAESYYNLESEVNELKHLLDDEKRYSCELKKELDRLHEVTANQTNLPKEEVPYLVQQIQVLEAGKSMGMQFNN